MHITRLLFGIVFVLFASTVRAEDYKILLPFPPGNLADVILRSMQASIERNTKDKLIITHMPGAETVVSANHFVTNRNFDMIWGSSSQVIWNPLLKDAVKYKDQDFQNVMLVGTVNALWVVRAESKIRTPQDLAKNLPDLVGGFATAYNLNLESVVRKYNRKSTIVPFKGTNDIVLAMLSGNLGLGLVTPSAMLFQHVKEGRLHIVGTSGMSDIVMEDIKIPSVPKALGVPGFNGISMILTHSDMDEKKLQRMRKLMWDAFQDPQTQQVIKNLYLTPDSTDNLTKIKNYISNEQSVAKEFLAKPVSIFK